MHGTSAPILIRNCPNCGHNNTQRVPTEFGDEHWPIKECGSCHFVYLETAPIYERLSEEFAWEKTSAAETGRRFSEEPVKQSISKLLKAFRRRWLKRDKLGWLIRRYFQAGNVLDVGCASGGIMKSLAGPAPNYDCQKILSTKSPEEASKMSGFISVILMPVRYFMTMGLCILGILYFKDLNLSNGTDGLLNFENIMPAVISKYLPVGLIGLVLAGFLGAFMSNFSGTLNAGQAYIVNDIYLKYFNPSADRKKIITMSYLSGIVMVIFGIGLGLLIKDVNMIFNIITAGLYGGFVCANVLKWYWWRFNANGFFYGMLAGIIVSAIPPLLSVTGITTYFDGTRMLYFFPLFIAIQFIACIIGTYSAPPTDAATLLNFYKTVRPWGFWKPVHEIALAEDPNFIANKNLPINMLNIGLGIIGQILLMLVPMYLILNQWTGLGILLALVAVIFIVMKRTWWNRLKEF